MSLAIEEVKRRCYLVGNTFPIKNELKKIGAHWDADRKAWWIGSDKREKLEAFCGQSTAPSESLKSDDTILGKARYKAREYLIVWEGETQRGLALKLAFRDGTRLFWAGADECEVTKRYREPLTLRKLNQLATEYKAQRQSESQPTQALSEGEVLGIAQKLAEAAGVQTTGEARKYTADEKVTTGEIRQSKKHGHVLVAVALRYHRYYHSEDSCEDNDCFCGQYGWKESHEYWGVSVSEPAEARRARLALEAKAATEVKRAAEIASDYAMAKAKIPADYRIRHGATLGGVWKIGESAGVEPAVQLDLQWVRIASRPNGDPKYGRNDHVFQASLNDGRSVYKEETNSYDDYRTTLYLPIDIWEAEARQEVAQLGITPEKAEAWLAQFRGCVGTELYEFAAGLGGEVSQ